jgi:PTH1 family peptidyl-tRNA hydrolase
MHYIIGLGNPGEEYAQSRHNTGRMAVENYKLQTNSKKVKIIDSGEFMNNSGRAVAKHVKSKKAAHDLIVVYDDIDLPLGTIKISWDKGSGGHRGLESVVKALKTKEFTRVRIGIAPTTPSGKIRKPSGEKAVLDFILSKFKQSEIPMLKKTLKKASEAIQTIVEEGREKAMNEFN